MSQLCVLYVIDMETKTGILCVRYARNSVGLEYIAFYITFLLNDLLSNICVITDYSNI